MAIAQFQAHCLSCHGEDGRGTDLRDDMPSIPDFTDLKWQESRSDLQLRKSISEGTKDLMPSMKRKLAPADIEEMVFMVRRFVGGGFVVPEDNIEPAASPPHVAARIDNSPHPLPNAAAQGAPRIDARAIYQRSCQRCHGADGRGTSLGRRLPGIPDFTSGRWQQSRSRAKLMASILEGKGEKMPAFRGKLDADQVSALVAYIRTFDSKQDHSRSATSQRFDSNLEQLRRESEELRRAFRELANSPVDRPIGEYKR
jgi:cytochrome c oxidase cbb3-type subunit 3